MADLTLHSNTETFIGDIKRLVEQGRDAAYGAVNAVMIETYWRIGQRIVEQEQNGKERADCPLLDSARQRQSFCRQIHAADAHPTEEELRREIEQQKELYKLQQENK